MTWKNYGTVICFCQIETLLEYHVMNPKHSPIKVANLLCQLKCPAQFYIESQNKLCGCRPEGGSLYRLPPLGSYPSKQVCMYPRLSVHNSIAKIFNTTSFSWRILFQPAHQSSWIIQDKDSICSCLLMWLSLCV